MATLERPDTIGKKYSFHLGYIHFTGPNTIATAWGPGLYDIIDSQRVTAYWNNHYHHLTFNSDATFFISMRTKPADSLYIQGTLYNELTRHISVAWICAELAGGIGNRLYQIAAALGLGERLGRPVIFYHPVNTRLTHQDTTNMYYLFPHIPICHDTMQTVQIDHHLSQRKSYEYYDIVSLAPSKNIVLSGNWQNRAYFPSYSLHPYFDMFLTYELRSKIIEKYNLETMSQRLSTWFIHVRLGDYKKYKELNHITLESYHKDLIKHIPVSAKIILFSNEPDAASTLMNTITDRKFIVCREIHECICLYIMQYCWGGAIVPNSTFSWWGSYFAYIATPHKNLYKSYYPSQWFCDDKKSGEVYTPPWGMR